MPVIIGVQILAERGKEEKTLQRPTLSSFVKFVFSFEEHFHYYSLFVYVDSFYVIFLFVVFISVCHVMLTKQS